jgi:2-amino-4-hydroxy-6-hydroxymethyldihydropteridine diphosphokinase
MPTCLLALGSNVGDRAATIEAALADITKLPDVQVARHSSTHNSRPIGGPSDQGEFLNAAAVIETRLPPLTLLHELQGIETRHGRERADRWSPRTLDIDLLLYANEVSETEMLTLPHPRMSFRRFVLEPSAEIAPRMLHPVIGWPIERLLLHLNAASDQVAILSPSETARREVSESFATNFNGRAIGRPTFGTAEHLWPAVWSTWISFPQAPPQSPITVADHPNLPYAAAAFPKLTIMLDADMAAPRPIRSEWSTIVRQPGRGPTLRLHSTEPRIIEQEVLAAVAAVWPDLGPTQSNRVK